MEWVTTSDVRRESWRRLLEYSNEDVAKEAIEKWHGNADRRTRANYKKQASQIRATILQAYEYFQAAEGSSLYTSPNHLFYGALSLASAVMLTRGNGAFSLDALRANSKNKNHGLEFSTGAT